MGTPTGPTATITTTERAAELRTIVRLAAPLAAAQIGWIMLGIVDTWMVGRLGPRELAGVALGDLWIFASQLMAMGLLMALDPLVAQAHGAGDGRGAGLALQRGVVLSLLAAVPLAGFWLAAEPGLRLLGQEPELAKLAGAYVRVQLPAVAPFLLFIALRQYLQARGIMLPTLAVVVVANLLNAGLNWVLIYGNLGAPALGGVGSGIATAITRVAMFAMLVATIRLARLHEGAWVPWSRAALDPRALWAMIVVGAPIAVQLGLEMWAFSIAALFAGWISAEALAAHTVAIKLAAFAYMIPLGISMAAATRVGNLVGARDGRGAERAAWTAIGLAGGVMLLFAVGFVVFRDVLPQAFLGAEHAATLAIAASVLPIAGAFQFFDATQAVGGGVLRGMGDTRPAAVANFVGYYLLALPLALWLGFPQMIPGLPGPGLGLPGIWIGLAAGLAAVSLFLMVRIRRRGPRSVVAERGGAVGAS